MQCLPVIDRRSSGLHLISLLTGNQGGVCANRSEKSGARAPRKMFASAFLYLSRRLGASNDLAGCSCPGYICNKQGVYIGLLVQG